MKLQNRFFILYTSSVLAFFQFGQLSAQELERVTGLVLADGWQAVQANCTECHSALLITQNSGSREVRESRIRWMQDTQGLQELAPELEATILDYLEEHYDQKDSTRRAPLSKHLLPENPYESNGE